MLYTAHRVAGEAVPLTGGAFLCFCMQAAKAQDPEQLLAQEHMGFTRSHSCDWSLKTYVQRLGGLVPYVIMK